ncbi:sensor histidine kinase [Lentzea flava]|uniref:Sensor-like histidine kinase SenX3 n=1 Tax=Lentzea flava TaxID=103732 RepID=A0ABQ2UBU5_9PSEU|nr:HAMP domain-containing sensor histidine kinase [Lentzea flava]MCP2197101.1 His Kinase A (phospho-acceptor) domain-containing protein [Lentzea flava]GGU13335.1 two-component sensor histidine kinase [Lentzea flava]
MRASWAEAERAEVRRARVRVSVLVGLAITVMIAFVGAIAYVVMVQAQETQVTRELRYNARFGVPGVAPRCAWVFVLRDGALDQGALPVPEGFPVRGDLDAVRSSGATVERDVSANGTEYMVLTTPGAGGSTVQAVFDLRYQLSDRRHLVQALGIALIAGLLVAALIGFGIGRRTLGPLADALARQRRFVTDASHELRTPIARAHLRAQLLSVAADLPDRHRDDLDALARSIRGLADVVDDLLLSAQLGRGLDGTPVDLAEVASSAVAGERERAAERRIALSVELSGGPLVVNGVETALRRAVDQLLANAVRHTPEGGRISVRACSDGGHVELVVSDTGEGFDPGEAERLFDRFHRGHGEKRFGLGLALVREIVTGHGGTVEADGQPGRGARFTVRLPVAGRSSSPLRERITSACP